MISSQIALVLALASANGQVPCDQAACDVSQPVVEQVVQQQDIDVADVIETPQAEVADGVAAGEPAANPSEMPEPTLPADAATVAQGEVSATEVESVGGELVQPAEGQIIVTGNAGAPKGDPAEEINVAAFETVQKIDDAVVAPVADAYDKGMPKPVRTGLRNFLRNLGEPINFLNFMLQLKVGKAAETLGRFAINSTVGVAGLMDPASKKPFNLPYRSNGFANTLGYYGVGPGPYLYLPFIGSTTVRDLFGRGVDLAVLPTAIGAPFNNPLYSIPMASLNTLETRILIDDQIRVVRDECGDPYAGTRDIYLITRQIEIDSLRGKQSKALADLTERLSLNCDIDAVRAAYSDLSAIDPMVEADAVEPVAVSEEATGDVMVEEVDGGAAAMSEAAEPVAPVIEFVSEPVVQPLSSDTATDTAQPAELSLAA